MNRLFLNTITAVALTVTSTLSAPVSWSGHYYEFVPASGIDWTTAQQAADGSAYNGLPGHLVTVTSQEENAFIATLVDGVVSYPGDPSSDSVLEAWIGGLQEPADELDSAAGWTWVNGEGAIALVNGSAPFANWFTGEPNDWLGIGTEQYLAMWGNDGYGNTIGSWNDEGGLWNISGYLVEYEAAGVPDAGGTRLLVSMGALCLAGLSLRRYPWFAPSIK